MAKVIICFVLTCVFSFMGYSSFMTNDYKPLQQWLIYYKEYKELQGAMDKGNLKKAELITRLMKLYPEKASQFEEMARNKYIDLSEEAKSAEERVTTSRKSYGTDSDTNTDSDSRVQKETPKQPARQSRTETTRSNTTTNNSNTNNKNKQ